MKKTKDIIIERIQNYLYSFYAKDIKTARANEIYDCLCRYLMEDIGKTWVKSKKIRDGYEVYILSFEYLPERFLPNIIYKLGLEADVREALDEMDFDYESIMNFDKDPDLGIGNIGMGSTYLINALTNQKIKATAYALRYQSGNFKHIIQTRSRRETSSSWLNTASNWEHRKGFTNILNIYGRDHKVVTFDMPVVSNDADFVNTLRLFKSDPTGSIDIDDFKKGDIINAYDDYINNSAITEFLYVDDSTYDGKILRLKQEYFYSAAAMRDFVRRYILYYKDIEKIKDKTSVIVNDIHPTLALIEFIRILTEEYDFTTKKAIAYTREIFHHLVFSITDDSLERYPIDEIRNMNPDIFATILEVQNELAKEEGALPFIEDGFVIFKNINMSLSKDYVFLSKILADHRNEASNICYMNMGSDRVSYGKSANRNLYKYLADQGIEFKNADYSKLMALKNRDDIARDLEEIKYQNKLEMIRYLHLEDENINPYSIFDMQLSNMHESKRQILNALAIAYEFFYLRDNANAYYVPKTYVFSGKANEGYFMAKETIKFILGLKQLIESDMVISKKLKIVFIDNYSISSLRKLLPAADIYSNLNHPLLDNQNFNIQNSVHNMVNIISGKGGVIENLDIDHGFYLLGQDYDYYKEQNYQANNFIYQNEIVRYTTEKLLNEPAENFPYDFSTLYHEILLYNDSFNVFLDLEDLLVKRAEMSRDYLDRGKWVAREIQNMIWAGGFDFKQLAKRKINFDKKIK